MYGYYKAIFYNFTNFPQTFLHVIKTLCRTDIIAVAITGMYFTNRKRRTQLSRFLDFCTRRSDLHRIEKSVGTTVFFFHPVQKPPLNLRFRPDSK